MDGSFHFVEFLSTPPSRVATRNGAQGGTGFVVFLSTPPSRVATTSRIVWQIGRKGFYPRHPRGWRPATLRTYANGVAVSIHATLAGGDSAPPRSKTSASLFLSTPPSRVATSAWPRRPAGRSGFYPRHPRGWRRRSPGRSGGKLCFYPRHPRGWRRVASRRAVQVIDVSIHATLAGGDSAGNLRPARQRCFYPRHPRGWRLFPAPRPTSINSFYPRHPRGWRRQCPKRGGQRTGVSIHATLAGGDAMERGGWSPMCRFYPRHPRGWRHVDEFIGAENVMFLSTPPSRVATG